MTDAETLVVVGRGIGSQKNLPLMQRLADLLGGKLACTRPLVEAGWCEYWHQVGQTGCFGGAQIAASVGVSVRRPAPSPASAAAPAVIAVDADPDAPIFGLSVRRWWANGVEDRARARWRYWKRGRSKVQTGQAARQNRRGPVARQDGGPASRVVQTSRAWT